MIVGREFRERVYKKSFIITTILMPLAMLLLSAAPTLIMEYAKTDTRHITVVDESGIVAPRLESDEEVAFVLSDKNIAETLVATASDEENFGVLHIGKDIIANPNDARLYTTSSSSIMLEESIAEQIEGVIEQAIALPHIDFEGIHFHIGSQIMDMIDFVALCNRINELTTLFERRCYPIRSINVGGGLGIDYGHPNHKYIPDFHSYFEVFRKHLHLKPGQTLHFELGRSIVAQCGSLISRVLYIKEGTCKRFAIIDGSMTQLIRPALYQAYHRIENISSDEPEMTYDVVGPVCESSDVFGKSVELNATHRGDFIAIRSAGAYGEIMASQYNCHELPKGYLSEEV